EKNADLIVANDVTALGAGFDVETNVVTLFSSDGRDLPLPKLNKREVAQRILDEVVRLSASVRQQSADSTLSYARLRRPRPQRKPQPAPALLRRPGPCSLLPSPSFGFARSGPAGVSGSSGIAHHRGVHVAPTRSKAFGRDPSRQFRQTAGSADIVRPIAIRRR